MRTMELNSCGICKTPCTCSRGTWYKLYFFLLAKEIQLGEGLVSLFMLGEMHIYKKVGKKIQSLIGRARWERLSCGGV